MEREKRAKARGSLSALSPSVLSVSLLIGHVRCEHAARWGEKAPHPPAKLGSKAGEVVEIGACLRREVGLAGNSCVAGQKIQLDCAAPVCSGQVNKAAFS